MFWKLVPSESMCLWQLHVTISATKSVPRLESAAIYKMPIVSSRFKDVKGHLEELVGDSCFCFKTLIAVSVLL